jgi:hypothetical protein
MPVRVLTDAFVYIGAYDYTGQTNEAQITAEAVNLDKTTFRSGGWNEGTMGLKSVDFNVSGFWPPDTTSAGFDQIGETNEVHTVGTSETEGDPCEMWQGVRYNPQIGAPVGDLAPFSVNSYGTDGVGVVRGFLLKEMATVSAIGATGTALELGAVAAGQYLYASFHVFTAGTTITAVLESDADNTFGSATTQITFGPYTTTGGRWGTRVAGPVTDTWYRLRVTSVTGSFVIACAAGIR